MNDKKIITPVENALAPPPQLAAKPPEPTRQTAEENKQSTQEATPTQLPQSVPGPVSSPTQEPEAVQIPLNETGEEKENLSIPDQVQLRLNLTWRKVMAVLLALQGLFGLYQSIHFILIEYPHLEKQLSSHLITQDAINSFASQAIIMIISTVLSMFFAIKLSVVQNKATKILEKVIAIFFFVANTAVMKYLNQIGSADIVNQFTIKAIDFLRDIL